MTRRPLLTLFFATLIGFLFVTGAGRAQTVQILPRVPEPSATTLDGLIENFVDVIEKDGYIRIDLSKLSGADLIIEALPYEFKPVYISGSWQDGIDVFLLRDKSLILVSANKFVDNKVFNIQIVVDPLYVVAPYSLQDKLLFIDDIVSAMKNKKKIKFYGHLEDGLNFLADAERGMPITVWFYAEKIEFQK